MKNVIFIVLLCSSIMIAQTASIDSCSMTSAQDTIRISDLVQQQINKALEKQSGQIVPAVSTAEINLVPKVVAAPTVYEAIRNYAENLPVHIQIFITTSFLVLLGLLIRRAVLAVNRRSSRILKNKISSIREEKVFVKENLKLTGERIKLKNRKTILNVSESHLSKLAKELKIAKGELLLASRLKHYEIGKM